MTALALQKKIIEKVSLTKNKSVLEKLDSILNEELPYQFSEFQQKILAESDMQVSKGEYQSQDELFDELEKWLEEK